MHNLQELVNPGASSGMQSRLAALDAEGDDEGNPVGRAQGWIPLFASLTRVCLRKSQNTVGKWSV